jgi:hypothetical protein
LRARLENICGEWHLTATDMGKPGLRLRSLLIRRNPPFPEHEIVEHENKHDKEHLMLDVVMLALGLGFFAAAVGYTYACERL